MAGRHFYFTFLRERGIPYYRKLTLLLIKVFEINAT